MAKIGVIDYGMGNIHSVVNALKWAGAEVDICTTPEEIDQVGKIVIPGVGTYSKCMDKLSSHDFQYSLRKNIVDLGKPTLGICLGMQIMSTVGLEGGEINGYDFIPGVVKKIKAISNDVKVPHIGWNNVEFNDLGFISDRLKTKAEKNFYFVHSYHFIPSSDQYLWGTCKYNQELITSAIIKDNIAGVQFHPEKSQENGILFLQDFINWNPC